MAIGREFVSTVLIEENRASAMAEINRAMGFAPATAEVALSEVVVRPVDRQHPNAPPDNDEDVAASPLGNYIFADQPWKVDANCRGVDPILFFPERGASTRDAKEVCRGCAVRLDCLDYALTNKEKFGIWGGLSEAERRRLRRGTPRMPRRTL